MKIISIIGLIFAGLQIYGQPTLQLRIGFSGSFAKMGIPAGNSFVRTNVMPGFTLGMNTSNLFNFTKLDYELNYAFDGHRYKIHNFINEEKVVAKLVRHNLDLTVFYNPGNILISEKKKPKFDFFIKPGLWFDYIIHETFKFYIDPAIHDPIPSKSLNWGGVICFELRKRKYKKQLPYNLDLRYYYGFLNISQQRDTKWFTRKFEIGITFPIKRVESKK